MLPVDDDTRMISSSCDGRKYFSTDGIRGRVGVAPVTPDFILKLGWAIGKALEPGRGAPILIGKDTRISGYMLESALEAGLSAAGADIRLLGPLPTPAVAYLTRNTRAGAGIVISASHNPYHDNGIKIFSRHGRKLPGPVELLIEEQLARPLDVVAPDLLGKARRITDAPRRYIEHCKSSIDCDLSGLRIAIDCANGAAYRIAPKVFEELGAEVHATGVEPDGFNINGDCGATMPAGLQKLVVERKADLGICLDGDADRLIMVDHKGELVDGDEIIFIIARAQHDQLNGGVVGTQMSNLGLEQAIQGLGLEFHRARVGDRYVMEMLDDRQLVLGGEQSGHIVNRSFADTGDGIIAALQALSVMQRTDKELHCLKAGMKKYPQALENITLHDRVDISEYPNIHKKVMDAQKRLNKSGRVLLRPSGTEPVLRVMVEGDDSAEVKLLAHTLTEDIKNIICK